MDYLSLLVSESVRLNQWHPIKLSKKRTYPPISHLLFADDILLFSIASTPSVKHMCTILEYFSQISGQQINLTKFKVLFLVGIRNTLKRDLLTLLQVSETTSLGSYLGFPLSHGNFNAQCFSGILTKLTSKLMAWENRYLNFSGRAVLIKSVLSSIPLHIMQCIKLPQSTLSSIDKLIRFFLWGGSSTSQSKSIVHYVSWKIVTKPLHENSLNIP